MAGNDQAGFAVQVPARVGGLADAAQFARALAEAAADFATWCEDQDRTRSYVPDSGEGWAGAHSLRLDAQS
ncbi:hypothetical protein AOZ06_11420 [Kibdelosporangium phytohabitans]|uniref:Uncharacterized protein n=1 Tax=Kibdelosporangium phytohabitans TaxID=860235 RepID=A0A0N9IH90_9PSEU|nr:hypothetical protein AOZ06_11420 [Kibdelosporangium phytohabitans]